MSSLRKNRFAVAVPVAFILLMISGSLCNAALSIKGFYPVSSKGEFCSRSNSSDLPHNPSYKEWCQNNFINGTDVYEAYRQVAFNIDHTPEPQKVDIWQTPSETMQSHSGDCEDAILLFNQMLPPHHNGGEIIWGFVHDLNNKTSFAHVWFQLHDKNGKSYIVEPFSGDWNGIIPTEIVKMSEIRQRIIGVPNTVVSDIMNKPAKHKNIKNFSIEQITMYDWQLEKLIDNVFAKLVSVSNRYRQEQR